MTQFLVLCYLGFWGAHPRASQLPIPFSRCRLPPTVFQPPLPLPRIPPRHPQSRLVSPPQSSPSHAAHGVGEAPDSTMPRSASGEVCEEPNTIASFSQPAVDTQPARVLLNTASQSHLSHCVKQSSILPPDKTHNPPTPLHLQAPEVLNLLPPAQPPPTPPGAPHITLLKNPQEEIYFIYLFNFFLWVKGSVEALHLHGHFEQRLPRSDCNHHKQIQ